jgi:hypothetical protein
MARVPTLAVAFLLVALAAPGQQPVQLQFQEGRVTLRAQNAPVRAILAEWARLGGATIVNGDRVTGPPLTLELSGVPERQALDIVLRAVAGYMLAPRRAGASGASAFDRILILPTSVAPQNPSPAPAAGGARPRVLPRPPVAARPLQAPPAPAPDAGPADEQADVEEDDPEVGAPPTSMVGVPAPTPPRAFPGPLVRPPVMSPPVPGGPELVPEQPDPQNAQPTTPAVTTTPSNPFGIPAGSSSTPGVIAPAPRPQQPNRVQ